MTEMVKMISIGRYHAVPSGPTQDRYETNCHREIIGILVATLTLIPVNRISPEAVPH